MRDKIIIKGIGGINSVSMYKNKDNYDVEGNNYIQKDGWVLIQMVLICLNYLQNRILMHQNIFK